MSFDGAGIDKVLAEAVDARAVPHVAAIVADRDGVIYEGAAGEQVVGGGKPVLGTHVLVLERGREALRGHDRHPERGAR